jgi:enterobactin synthetase component D / holo-[acyl-carrier protein] synthase
MPSDSVIGSLLPSDVAAVETWDSAPLEALFPEELVLVERAVPKRQAEFATARRCAHEALAEIGAAPVAILSGPQREPLWPDGVVGSITHRAGYHAAAVARATAVRSIGIDAEPDEPLPVGVLELISLPAERAQLGSHWGAQLDRLLFSAKESVYKTWFPLTGRWLSFEDAVVSLHQDGSFHVEVKASGPLGTVKGRWLARNGLVLTAIALPVLAASSAPRWLRACAG